MNDYDLDVEFDDVGRITRITITSDDVKQSMMSDVKFRDIRQGQRPVVHIDYSLLEQNLNRIRTERPTRGRGKLTSESFHQLIADTYAMCNPNHPIQDISEWTDTNPNTVSGWVHTARKRGFMEPYWNTR